MLSCKKLKRKGRNAALDGELLMQSGHGIQSRLTFDSVKKKLNFDEDFAILPYEAGKQTVMQQQSHLPDTMNPFMKLINREESMAALPQF